VRRAVLALAACGGSSHPPGADAPAGSCHVDLSGNFTESSDSTDACPTLAPDDTGHQVLAATVASTTLGTSFDISVDLGPMPATGLYSSETVATWNALAIQERGQGECIFQAGATAVPTGSFTLTLDDAAPHGTLRILNYVLALLGTNCGAGDIETLELRF
jgi:hypothetical protein